ncbi:MAG: DUF4097 family beta strand repeat protein [Candidatus Eremiobacteraeota bacterium]|nr:DUF4097 family beta strand repeat protein [Candidatus Eremiobacteraeota bacterium]
MPRTIRGHKRALLLLLPLLGCSHAAPFATTVGVLRPGTTLSVNVARATINAYQPAGGQPRDRFTVEATAAKGTTPAAPRLRATRTSTVVDAADPLATLLVRVPDGVELVVRSQQGDVNVTDISGNASVTADKGNVRVFVRESYAQARTIDGNVSVAMGSTQWPGTLHFSAQHGDVEISVEETAAFRVHLQTGDGTLFTDFDLRGTSNGTGETIDGVVNGGGGRRAIDVRVERGSIRLLRLHAQA